MTFPRRLSSRLRNLADLLYPVTCLVCGVGVTGPVRLCPDCRRDLPRTGDRCCPRCARPDTDPAVPCGRCQRSPPAFAGVFAPFRYAEPLALWIRELKYAQRPGLEHTLAALAGEDLGGWLASRQVDLVVAMPLHRRRLAERGYNQALLVAQRLARAQGLPVSVTALHRTRHTPPQAGLPDRVRSRNVRGAFAARAGVVAGRRLALVDDVITTGATVDAAATALIAAGATAVHVVTVARA